MRAGRNAVVASLIAAGWFLGAALALSYRVDPAGGPLTLAEGVAEAFAAWRDAGAEEEVVADEDADTVFAYGDPALFGPDTVSLTLRRGGETTTVEVLLDPGKEERLPRALLHEAGVLLGLGPASGGVMDPALGADEPTAPTEADATALREAREFPREDLNRDGVVDVYDLALFAAAYGTSGVSVAADFDDDGTVDDEDLALLRAAYVFLPPSETPPESLQPEDVEGGEGETPEALPEFGEEPVDPEAEAAPEAPPEPDPDAPPEDPAGDPSGDPSEDPAPEPPPGES